MREKVFDRHRVFRIQDLRLILIVDLYIFKFRDKVGHGCIELKMSLFVKHHHSDTRNRFRHGVDTVYRIRFDGFLIFHIPHTHGFKMNDFPASGDDCEESRYTSVIDIPLHDRTDAFETFSRKTGSFWCRHR